MKIWKWTLSLVDTQMIDMPKGAKILDVQMQNGLPQLWAICDENADRHPRRINIFGTGHQLPENAVTGEHIGTFQLAGGQLVFHAFEGAR